MPNRGRPSQNTRLAIAQILSAYFDPAVAIGEGRRTAAQRSCGLVHSDRRIRQARVAEIDACARVG